MTNVIKAIHQNKLVGIIRENDTKKAIEIANAYIEGGIKIIEMTTTIEAVSEVAKNKEIYVAKGGIITREQALNAIKANAKLLVSPILQMGLVKLSSGYKTPLVLTATTPNEAYQAWQARIPLIKIYPIKDLGGPGYIEELLRPMSFLNVMPTGTIKVEDIKAYLKAGATAVGLGRALYADKTYDEIKETVKEAVKIAGSF
ncbi:MAG: bifunctional 4-hydroxy-2-oxoglutarate aldolase/2-dehydro-3-deoxy-phosphogluconate aldolase [bacterium]|nr:bifunctional 4-hydroxy-2-oxoglutarate aldolase/2-dehydro-3-deoxy-phosphogluconate aldolase [bacterium]